MTIFPKIVFPLFLIWIGFGFLCLSNCACSPTNTVDQIKNQNNVKDKSTPSSLQNLRRTFRQKRMVTVVYGEKDQALAKKYQQLFSRTQIKGYLQVEFKNEKNISPEELTTKILCLIGTPRSNALLEKMSSQLPLHFSDQSFDFHQKKYDQIDHIFQLAFYPNPNNPSLPINILSGNDDEAIFDYLQKRLNDSDFNLFWFNWSYEIFNKDHRILLGFFTEDQQQVDTSLYYDFSNTDTLRQTEHFNFISHQSLDPSFDIIAFAKKCEQRYHEITHFLGLNKNTKINYFLYPSSEYKGLMIRNTAQSNISFKSKEVHTVINAEFKNNFIEKENEILIRDLLGTPKHKALERGLAICFTNQWQKKGYEYWAARLKKSGHSIPLRELFDDQTMTKESDLIMGAMSGALVDFLMEHFGKNTFLKKYPTWKADPQTIASMEIEWQKYLENLVKKTPFPERKKESLPYLKGFNFAHEGYAIYNGYISQQASQSLQRLANIGTNSVSIIPYSYMRDPLQPSPLPIMRDPGTENDESVIHSAFSAKELGMKTMLKPQIWFRGSWPGALTFEKESDWQAFFKHYERWIVHYALLAEINEIDLLCIGVEFEKATLSHEADWRKIFKKIRGLYSGYLTYSANWGTEVEQVEFWDELDYIGLSCYYPLSDSETATKSSLKKGFAKTVQKLSKLHQKFNKPILLTEIGFRAVEAPWRHPHEEPNGRRPNPAHQKMCYEVVFESLVDQEWCAGIYWWKWPTNKDYHYPEGFTPINHPAEKVVEKWFLN